MQIPFVSRLTFAKEDLPAPTEIRMIFHVVIDHHRSRVVGAIGTERTRFLGVGNVSVCVVLQLQRVVNLRAWRIGKVRPENNFVCMIDNDGSSRLALSLMYQPKPLLSWKTFPRTCAIGATLAATLPSAMSCPHILPACWLAKYALSVRNTWFSNMSAALGASM